ncbi:MAG: bifunctional 2-polyprenyl-6-hydroxyphenol methylase/3-demethylubiquinol 3-O-methyltransferase UbiG [Pseudomonadota bacterium]
MENTENIDLNELEKFSSRANQWWDTTGDFKTLHQINPVRLDFIKRNIALNGIDVLDVGCGGGILAESMAKESANVTGIDASKENILIAGNHAKEQKLDLNYVTTTAETFSKNNVHKFDLVTCMELLEHVPEPLSVIMACSNLVKPGGHVILSTINRNIKAYTLAVLAGEYLLGLLPKGTHHYDKFIRPSELVNWCLDAGLTLNDLSGIDYNPLLNRCSLSPQSDVNYLIDTIKND